MSTKLSKLQQNVLDKMKDGWQLGQSVGTMNSRSWIQKGGCGHGGESQDVNAKTANALIARGLIKVHKREFPLKTFLST